MPHISIPKEKIKTNGIFKTGMKNYDYVYEIVNRMAFIREKSGYTRADLSRVLGKADNYLSHLEKCRISLSMEFFATFLRLFHIHPKNFFDDNFYIVFGQEEIKQQLKIFVEKKSKQIEERKLERQQSKKED